MKYYVIVEGEVTEKTLYKYWINYLNPALTFTEDLENLQDDNYFIFAGYGYPNYFEVIEAAIADIDTYDIDRLVIAVDSEEMTFDEKLQEIWGFVRPFNCQKDIKIVIQHFCIETWGLGNRKINSRNIQNRTLREYKNHFDVYARDPELLQVPSYEVGNKAKFAMKYLAALLREKNPRMTYSKSNPKALVPIHFFNNIHTRFLTTDHIKSFQTFINAFS